MPRFARRSLATLLALAFVCTLLVSTGTAVAAGAGGGGGGGGAKSGGSAAGGGAAGGSAAGGSAAGGSAAGGGAAGGGLSGSGPLGGGVTSPGTPTPTTTTQAQTSSGAATTTTSGSGGGSIGQTSVIGIVIGAVIVIGGVCIYIFRDAGRRSAKDRRGADSRALSGQARVPGSKREKPRKLSAQEKKRRKRGRAPRRK